MEQIYVCVVKKSDLSLLVLWFNSRTLGDIFARPFFIGCGWYQGALQFGRTNECYTASPPYSHSSILWLLLSSVQLLAILEKPASSIVC